jgi:hypothetical protein
MTYDTPLLQLEKAQQQQQHMLNFFGAMALLAFAA